MTSPAVVMSGTSPACCLIVVFAAAWISAPDDVAIDDGAVTFSVNAAPLDSMSTVALASSSATR